MQIDWRSHIHSDPEILLGKPVIRGTRISVELILELLSEGWSADDLMASYSGLSQTDLLAVFAYLRDCIQQELYFPIRQAG
ncbi:MAG: DUF433 domain-containing protein [Bacteroidia bacterium]|nr:DUF433 domain-containing protein [Bacteroidia bacterium]